MRPVYPDVFGCTNRNDATNRGSAEKNLFLLWSTGSHSLDAKQLHVESSFLTALGYGILMIALTFVASQLGGVLQVFPEYALFSVKNHASQDLSLQPVTSPPQTLPADNPPALPCNMR